MVWLPRNEKQTYQLKSRPQMWPWPWKVMCKDLTVSDWGDFRCRLSVWFLFVLIQQLFCNLQSGMFGFNICTIYPNKYYLTDGNPSGLTVRRPLSVRWLPTRFISSLIMLKLTGKLDFDLIFHMMPRKCMGKCWEWNSATSCLFSAEPGTNTWCSERK